MSIYSSFLPTYPSVILLSTSLGEHSWQCTQVEVCLSIYDWVRCIQMISTSSPPLWLLSIVVSYQEFNPWKPCGMKWACKEFYSINQTLCFSFHGYTQLATMRITMEFWANYSRHPISGWKLSLMYLEWRPVVLLRYVEFLVGLRPVSVSLINVENPILRCINLGYDCFLNHCLK